MIYTSNLSTLYFFYEIFYQTPVSDLQKKRFQHVTRYRQFPSVVTFYYPVDIQIGIKSSSKEQHAKPCIDRSITASTKYLNTKRLIIAR